MPSSFQALAVLVAALLPGALFVWSFERLAGRYGLKLTDRVLRFIGGSAVYLAFLAWPIYWMYTEFWPSVSAAEPVTPWLALVPILHVAIPVAAGTAAGFAVRKGWKPILMIVSPNPAPRAWDYLFQYEADGWIRIKLKSGIWIAGAYANENGRRSYAAGYPEDQDLYLAASVQVDPLTGEFMTDENDDVKIGEGGLLIRWEEVEYLEFINAETEEEK